MRLKWPADPRVICRPSNDLVQPDTLTLPLLTQVNGSKVAQPTKLSTSRAKSCTLEQSRQTECFIRQETSQENDDSPKSSWSRVWIPARRQYGIDAPSRSVSSRLEKKKKKKWVAISNSRVFITWWANKREKKKKKRQVDVRAWAGASFPCFSSERPSGKTTCLYRMALHPAAAAAAIEWCLVSSREPTWTPEFNNRVLLQYVR